MTEHEAARAAKLQQIQYHSDFLSRLVREYDRLKFLCERDGASDQLIELTEEAGTLARDSLNHTATLVEVMRRASWKLETGDGDT